MRNKKILIALFIIFLLSVMGYAAYTARNAILGPRLELGIPGGVMTSRSQVVEISGSTINTTELKMNNRVLVITAEGAFNERMLLSVGNNVFVFDAVDKFGRSAQEVLQIVYTPETGDVLQLKDNGADINNINNNHDGKEKDRD